mmetsp:Transcript_29170/g.56796  ORF Transcript_29170/g.56796 Transcript_29170/m.56796 type:complete len:1721 (-) Transcript_29170:714-5876(-)
MSNRRSARRPGDIDDEDNRSEASQRRSKRQRVSRFVTYGDHKVLKLNDYTLEAGESSVFSHEAKAYARVEVGKPKPKNSWQIFTAEFWRDRKPPREFRERQRLQKEAWDALSVTEREVYSAKSKKMKEEYEEAKLAAEEKAKEMFEKEKENESTILKEQNRVAENEARARKLQKQERKVPRKPRDIPDAEKKRLKHNAKMNKTKAEMRKRRARFMALQREFIAPFVPDKILNALPKLSDEEKEAMHIAAVDVEADPAVKQPKSIVYGTMRPYQLKGIEWMLYMYENNTNMILGDEMGLGKTLQTIAFLAALRERGIEGPHLVIVPLSVISSWMQEFRRWCPSMRVVRLHSADKAERERLRKSIVEDLGKYDVILTTYDSVKVPEMKRSLSGRVLWRVVVLDEGHRVKNHEAQISQVVRKIHSELILLLTGTPLQNNLRELWSMLYYLHPETFVDITPFETAFELNTSELTIDREMLKKAHYMLRPFMLRRLKKEVEKILPPRVETKVMCPLSEMQQFWYKRLLLKNKNILLRAGENAGKGSSDGEDTSQDWRKLQSLMMQLRKCCNHPFLFPGAEDSIRGSSWGSGCDESIITTSGKIENLDRLLVKLKDKGHRVVIFSQFTRFLDIIDDYLRMRGYAFARLDGSTNRVQRMVHIQEFNKPNSPYFAFIMSTRAGGLGVNLQTADTVILMDSDWNPQVDMQAMARCHRIGQKKIVHVYRFISAGTMEERVVQRAQKKLFLDTMVNRGSTAQAQKMDKMGTKEVLETLAFGIDQVFDKSEEEDREKHYLTDEDIAELIDRVDPAEMKTAPIKRTSSLKKNQRSNAANFKETAPLTSLRIFQGMDYSADKNATLGDIATEWQKTAKVRNRKSRFVQVDGHTVLKQNMYSMEDGEPSVLEQEGKSSRAQSFVPTAGGRQVAGRDFDHMSVCLNCWDGGDLVCCDYCPASYHLECLGMRSRDLDAIKFQWSCPAHSCITCARKASAVGGMLFRCEMCPMAYCEDHLPDIAREQITNRCERFIRLGQIHPKQACFILCSEDCASVHKASDNGLNSAKALQAWKIIMNKRGSQRRENAPGSKKEDIVGREVEKEDDDNEPIRGFVVEKVKSLYVVEWENGETTKHRHRTVIQWLVDVEELPEGEKPGREETVDTELTEMVVEDVEMQEVLRPTPFERLSISHVPNEALKRWLSIAVETSAKPLALEDIIGFKERCRKAHAATLSRLYGLVFEAAYNKATVVEDLGTWSGIATAYPNQKAPGVNPSENEREQWRTTVANLYLRLIRSLQSDTSSNGYPKHVVRQFADLLGLEVETNRGYKDLSKKCPGRTLPEIVAMFLAFPCPGSKQKLRREFVEEIEEEEWTEPSMDYKPLKSLRDLVDALMDELKSADMSRKALAEHLGVGHQQLLKWQKSYDSKLDSDCFTAGEIAIRWMLHERAQDWSWAVHYHQEHLKINPSMSAWERKEFDSEAVLGRILSRLEKASSYLQEPEIQSLLALIRMCKSPESKTEHKELLWMQLEERGWTLEKMNGKVYMYLSPNRKRLDDLVRVERWFQTTSVPADLAQERQQMSHETELTRLMDLHNVQLSTIQSQISLIKASISSKRKEWTDELMKSGWKIMDTIRVEGQPRAVTKDMKAKPEEKHMVSAFHTLFHEPGKVRKAREDALAIATLRKQIKKKRESKLAEAERQKKLQLLREAKKAEEKKKCGCISSFITGSIVEIEASRN